MWCNKKRIVVKKVRSKEEYLQFWMKAMEDVHWFKGHRPFDYDREEMTEELLRDFGKSDNVYLLATPKGRDENLGVLGIKLQEGVGTLRRWEPAVPLKHRSSGASEALIEEGLSWLRKKGVPKATCMLKYPYDLPETSYWHINLYKKCGFKQRGPTAIALLFNLKSVVMPPSPMTDISITKGDNFTLEDFTDFTLRAFMSTPEDRAIHRYDPFVSNREESLKIHRSIKHGKMGFSPPECWKVALVKGKPAGFAISFMPKSKYRPPHGVIGELGVFPEFRRRGIAYALVAETHKCFKKYGCHYSYVSTFKNNDAAIRLYKKAGYQPVFELISFEKRI